MSFHKAVAVEEGCFASFQGDLLLLIKRPWHKAQGHPSCPKFLSVAITVEVRQVVACVGVAQGAALGVEDSVEASDEHVGRYTNQQRFVDPLEHLPWRRDLRALSGELQHAAGGGHVTKAAGTPLPVASPTTSPSLPSGR